MAQHRVLIAAALLAAWLSCPAASAGEPTDKVIVRSVASMGPAAVARLDREGTIHLLCEAPGSPRYARSTDEGVTFSEPVAVVPESARAAGLEFAAWDLAVGKGGRVHVAMGTNAWRLKLPQEDWGYFHAYLGPGERRFSPARNINRKPSEGFSIAADGVGNVTACWLSDRLYANVSRDNGTTFAPFVELDPTYNPCNCCTTSATYDESGRLAVLYREETDNRRDMYLVLWDQSRGGMSRRRISRTLWKIEACPMSYFAVASRPGGFTAVWPTRGEIVFTHLDEQAVPLAPGEIKTPGRAGMRTGMLALDAPDGTTLVAWKQDGRLGWQLYEPNGQPAGPPSSEPSPGSGVAGVVTRDGRFVLFR